jgi:hypothetical protein
MQRWASAALAIAVLFAATPAAAQQAPAPWGWPLHPTEAGKPPIYDPQFAAKADRDRQFGCMPGFECRLRLLGVIQNNGAVELQATAFRW